jgi:hypothetical protein
MCGHCGLRAVQPSEMVGFKKRRIRNILCFNVDKPAYKICDIPKRAFVVTKLLENELLRVIRV